MNEVIAQALAESVSKGNMTIEQVPIPYQEEIRIRLEQDGDVKGAIEARAKVME